MRDKEAPFHHLYLFSFRHHKTSQGKIICRKGLRTVAMSGFEVAGVVLGSIPLIVSALEHYKQGMSTIKTWRNYDRELRSLIRNLETEKIRFQDICEKLLIGLVPSSQIEHMVDDPFGRLWRQDSVQDAIKARLWRSYELFHSIVKDMEAAIKDIMRRLDLQPDGKVEDGSETKGYQPLLTLNADKMDRSLVHGQGI